MRGLFIYESYMSLIQNVCWKSPIFGVWSRGKLPNMANKCNFQVPDSDFHVPACAPLAPRQQERALPPPSSNASCRSFRLRGETFRISRLQGPSRTCVGTGSLPGRIVTKQKLSIRLLMVLFGLSRSRDLLSNFQLPASAASGASSERNFQLPSSGEHLRTWPF